MWARRYRARASWSNEVRPAWTVPYGPAGGRPTLSEPHFRLRDRRGIPGDLTRPTAHRPILREERTAGGRDHRRPPPRSVAMDGCRAGVSVVRRGRRPP